LAYGQFLDWLGAEFGWHRSTAYRFMQVAEAFSAVEISQFEKFALRALSPRRPHRPRPRTGEALARAAPGRPSPTARRAILALHEDAPLEDDQPLETDAIRRTAAERTGGGQR
jgi:hypothetical protein